MIISRTRALVFGALFLGAGGAMRAQAPAAGTNPGDNAPLQESKQALRQLQKVQSQRSQDGASGLRGALPQVTAPDTSGYPGDLTLPPPGARKQKEDEAEKKRRAGKNWLVDGMLRLEGKRPEVLLPGGEEEEEKIESSDPEFLLKTYLKEQQAREEADERKSRDAAQASPAVDSMAPFLREWLSGSPVEKAALGELADTPGSRGNSSGYFPGEIAALSLSGGEYINPVGEGILSSSRVSPVGDERGSANPFLQGLDWGGLPAVSSGPANVPAHPVPVAPPPPAAQPAPAYNPLPDLPRSSRSNERKPPPSPHKENDKFFPQQKKF